MRVQLAVINVDASSERVQHIAAPKTTHCWQGPRTPSRIHSFCLLGSPRWRDARLEYVAHAIVEHPEHQRGRAHQGPTWKATVFDPRE